MVALLSGAQDNWYALGLQLKVDSSLLNTIKLENARMKDCLIAMVSEWLKMVNPRPSWEQLVKALHEDIVGCRALAIKIAREHEIFFQGRY